jgi:AraC-like DNA-binding protein
MKVYLKFDYAQLTKKIVEEKLSELDCKFSIIGFGEFNFLEKIPTDKIIEITSIFDEYGIKIVENHKSILVQKIKDTIIEMVNTNKPINIKSSVYIAEKLDLSYSYLSNIFSEVSYTSIENFIIIQKIELAKQLMINTTYNLTEISIQLNYSSVAHLSTQFKHMTGMTPSAFQKIITKRRKLSNKINS